MRLWVGLIVGLLVLGLLALVLPHLVSADSTNTCPAGSWNVNASGSYICVPSVNKVKIPFMGVYVIFNGSGIYVNVTSFDKGGITGAIDVRDPDFNIIKSLSIDIPSVGTQEYVITLPSGTSYDFVVVNGTVNGYDLGTFAVSKEVAPVINLAQIKSIKNGVIVATILVLATLAPFLGVALRGSPKYSGAGLLGLGVLYIPILHALGLTAPLPEFVGTVSAVTGLLFIAVNFRTS